MHASVMKKILSSLEKEYPGFSKHYREEPFHALIGTVLSQRTRDETTDRITNELFKVADTPGKMSKLSAGEIRKIIKPINFYRTKADRIREISLIISERYGGAVPKTRENLMALPGVGPKTADCVLSFSFGKGNIPIDTHVEVISKGLGIANDNDDYNEIQEKLYKLVPERKRTMVNFLLVEHGKKVCRKYLPRHEKCVIRKYCRFIREIKNKRF